jgi:xanthine dehydrogenase accessory factor
MGFHKKINELLSSSKPVALVTVLESNANKTLLGLKLLISADKVVYSELPHAVSQQIAGAVDDLVKAGKSSSLTVTVDIDAVYKLELFVHAFSPAPRLIIFGGGHVGAALCRAAAQLDFEIVVIDDRPSFATQRAHPQAHRVICESYDRVFSLLTPSATDYIVIVTRGHQHDRLCLEKSLRREAAYVGMIGSRHRVAAQLKDMAANGFSVADLEKVYSPIGLPIGAITEGEIAISILAEIIRVRRSGNSNEAAAIVVLQELMRIEQQQERAVLVTMISSKGSTPRKTGSQMIVYPDGSLVGTIGGGCSESEARREALFCFDQNKSGRLKLRLTADAAAEEGMACGGIMELYFELLPFTHRGIPS